MFRWVVLAPPPPAIESKLFMKAVVLRVMRELLPAVTRSTELLGR